MNPSCTDVRPHNFPPLLMAFLAGHFQSMEPWRPTLQAARASQSTLYSATVNEVEAEQRRIRKWLDEAGIWILLVQEPRSVEVAGARVAEAMTPEGIADGNGVDADRDGRGNSPGRHSRHACLYEPRAGARAVA